MENIILRRLWLGTEIDREKKTYRTTDLKCYILDSDGSSIRNPGFGSTMEK